MAKGRKVKRLQKIKKGTINYNMGYRWRDSITGREFSVHPFGYEGVYVPKMRFTDTYPVRRSKKR
jgi:hypothetical protein